MMNWESKKCDTWRNVFFLLFRVGFGMFFFLSGLPKFQALIAGTNPLAGFGIAMWIAWIVAIIEMVGGAFMVLGLLMFPSGVLIAIVMIFAMFYATVSPFNAKSFFLHWIYIWGALLIGTLKNQFCALDAMVCKNKPKKK